MKFVAVFASVAITALLSACASSPQSADGNAPVAANNDRCHVTGSNLPKRDCRGDVSVLPPSQAENVMPVLPSKAPRN
jgi:type IV pilus biogenesis protein CpaD/CtpE